MSSSYLISVNTGNGNDNIRLDFIDNDTVMDIASNLTTSGFINGGTYSIDRTSPVVTSITSMSQTNASSVEYAVNFSEPVIGVDGGDFSLFTINNAMITNISGSGNQYMVSIALQPGSDSIRLDMNDNDSITDSLGNSLGGVGAGNGNFIGNVFNIAIDTPIATSIIRSNANPTNAASLDFIVTFSEPVDGLDTSDFTLSNGAVITNISNSNPFYIITVNTGLMEGELKLQLMDDDSVRNSQGIPLGGNGIGNANFINGETYIVDRTPPQVTSIIRASSNPAINPTVDFIVTFSEPVINVEMSDFVVTGSNLIKSTVLEMQNADPFYWVKVGTGAGSGTLRLDLLDNGNITDRAGNQLANRSFTGESFNIAKTTVDFSAPTINSISNGVTNDPLLPFTWSSVWSAQAYEVFVARDSSFSQPVFTQTTTETRFIPTSPLTDGMYYARVRAYNAALNPGKFSKTVSLTVDSTPFPTPILLSPSNGSATVRRPWFKWSAVTGAVKYQIEIDNNLDFSSPEFSASTNKTTLQAKNLLSRPYFWRVRVSDAAGNWSIWSVPYTFTPR